MKNIKPTVKLSNAIQKSRPSLKKNSLNLYLTSLRSLYKRLFGDDGNEELSTTFLKDKKLIMKDIDTHCINSKKNILTAILVALSSESKRDESLIDFYQLKLKELSEKYNNFLEKQEKTETQKKNWIEYDMFISVINELLEKIKKADFLKKPKLTRSEYVLLQKYVILSFYQVFPMRNDIADMKILNKSQYDDLEKDEKKQNNYFVKDGNTFKIYLNAFKNVSRIGVKTFDIPEKLSKIVKVWLKYNKSGYLFTIGNGRDPLSPNGVTKLLNSIFMKSFNKKISSSMLRHISISEKLKNEPSLLEKKKEEQKTEDIYMHSAGMNEKYRKI